MSTLSYAPMFAAILRSLCIFTSVWLARLDVHSVRALAADELSRFSCAPIQVLCLVLGGSGDLEG